MVFVLADAYRKVFDEACERAPNDYWIRDGVHPTCSGHQVMANEWEHTAGGFYDSFFA